MLDPLLSFAFGLAGLALGADLLVRGAARLALRAGLSPMLIGLTLVAFGGSAPETTVALAAGRDGHGGLALGTLVGSTVFNILCILGLAALIRPVALDLQVLRQQISGTIGAALAVLLLALDGHLGPLDAAVLGGALLAVVAWNLRRSRGDVAAEAAPVYEAELRRTATPRSALNLAMVAGGGALLWAGAQAVVGGAVEMAQTLGVSELVLGLTAVAIGAALPELLTLAVASWRGERELAVGLLIGSCGFNALGAVALAALAAPGGLEVPASVARFDLWVMVAASLALLPLAMPGRLIARWEGVVLLSYYAAYAAYVVLASRHGALLPDFNAVMLTFVLPLTLVTLVVATLRPPR